MVKLVALHYQSGAEFHLNPETFTGVEYLPTENLTRIDVIGGYGQYKCSETPEEIQGLIDRAEAAPCASPLGLGSGVALGPVFGDGSEMEARADGSELGSGWRGGDSGGRTIGGPLGERSGFHGVRSSTTPGDDR